MRNIGRLALVFFALFSFSGIASAYSVEWYVPEPLSNITRIEAYISGGTFIAPLNDFRVGNNAGNPALAGWSSFVALNYPGTAVVASGPASLGVEFNVNFTGTPAQITFYAMDTGRNVVFSECYNFTDGAYGATCSAGALPTEVPSVPIPAAAWLLASGLIGLVGVGRRKIAA